MLENPGRPPKQWMRDCVRGASRSARDPGAVCGSLWYHKMSESERRRALSREGRALENRAMPRTESVDTSPAGTLLAVGIGAVVIFGLFWAMKKDDTESTTPPKLGCASYDDLTKFSQATGYHVFFVENQPVATWKPPRPEVASDPLARPWSAIECSFYRYSEGVWVPDLFTNDQLDAWRKGGKVVLSGHPLKAFSIGYRDRRS